MENQYQDVIDRFEKKLHSILANYNDLLKEKERVQAELNQKKEDLITAHHTIQELRSSYERLKIAGAMRLSEEDKKEADKRLSKLVRDINTCLELLKE